MKWKDLNLLRLSRFIFLFAIIPLAVTLYLFWNSYEEHIPLREGEEIPTPEPPLLAKLFRLAFDYDSLEVCVDNQNEIPPLSSISSPHAGQISIKILDRGGQVNEILVDVGEKDCKPLKFNSDSIIDFVVAVNDVHDGEGETFVDTSKTKSFVREQRNSTSVVLNFVTIFVAWGASWLFLRKLYDSINWE